MTKGGILSSTGFGSNLKTAFIREAVAMSLAGLLLAMCGVAKAQPVSGTFVHTGAITRESLAEFRSAVQQDVVSSIAFHDSQGAADWAPLLVKAYAAIIQEHQLDTYVRGTCSSACAAIFMFGKHKVLLPSLSGTKTLLHFHPVAHIASDNTDRAATQEIIDAILRQNPDFPELQMLNRMYAVKDRFGGILMFRDTKKQNAQIFFQERFGATLIPEPPFAIEHLGITTGE